MQNANKNSWQAAHYFVAIATFSICALLGLRRCQHRPSPEAPVQAAISPSATARAVPPNRVVLISLDGVSKAVAQTMPQLREMFSEGSGTTRALVPPGHTTSISHNVLFSGADPEFSGVDCEPDEERCMRKFPYVHAHYHGSKFSWAPLLFTPPTFKTLVMAVEEAGYGFRGAVQKGKLAGLFRRSGQTHGIISTENVRQIVATACEALRDDRIRLVILHFKGVDGAGHLYHWGSKEQYAEAALIDAQLREIRGCIRQANDRAKVLHGVQTILIVTADHGGTPGGGHCGRAFDNDATWLVPWVAVGPGIKPGYEIVGRPELMPAHGGVLKPRILLADTVPTILRLLKLSPNAIPTLSKRARTIDEIFL